MTGTDTRLRGALKVSCAFPRNPAGFRHNGRGQRYGTNLAHAPRMNMHESNGANDSLLNPDIFRERLRDLYARHHGLVRRACRRYVQNRDDADDLAQEVLLKAAQAWDGFKGDCTIATWLHRVAVNHCADHHRRRRRQRDGMLVYAAGLESPVRNWSGPETLIGPARVLEQLRGASGSYDRHIAYLRFDVGMKRDGIARITGLSRAGVAKRLARIRARATRLWMSLPVEERETRYGRGTMLATSKA